MAEPAVELTPRIEMLVTPSIALELKATLGTARLRSSKLMIFWLRRLSPLTAETLSGIDFRSSALLRAVTMTSPPMLDADGAGAAMVGLVSAAWAAAAIAPAEAKAIQKAARALRRRRCPAPVPDDIMIWQVMA